MGKVVLVIEYDGTEYHGFQLQEGAPTIQGEVERAIQSLTGERVRIAGAGRTDAGVHARGQVVAFVTESTLPPETMVRGLNFYLPQDIAVKRACRVADSFNVRRDALRREYRYLILNSQTPSPLWHRYACLVSRPLSAEAMNEAAGALVGRRDFASFTGAYKGSTVRTVYNAGVNRKGDLVSFDMAANSFLPHQVRNTAGALVSVGLGRMSIGEFFGILMSESPGACGPAATPRGLYLMKVSYPDIEEQDS